MDHIDLIVCRIFEIDPSILTRRTREGRLVEARFAGMHIRHNLGVSREEISRHYQRERAAVANGLMQAQNMLETSPEFATRYNRCLSLINDKRTPYSPDLARVGAKVWTRVDSQGNVIAGTIKEIEGRFFNVISFEFPHYYSVHRLDDGRVTAAFETSRDIILIEA